MTSIYLGVVSEGIKLPWALTATRLPQKVEDNSRGGDNGTPRVPMRENTWSAPYHCKVHEDTPINLLRIKKRNRKEEVRDKNMNISSRGIKPSSTVWNCKLPLSRAVTWVVSSQPLLPLDRVTVTLYLLFSWVCGSEVRPYPGDLTDLYHEGVYSLVLTCPLLLI